MADGKVLKTIIDISGRLDPSLGGSLKSATGLIKAFADTTALETAAISAGLGIATAAAKQVVDFYDSSINAGFDWEKEMSHVVKVSAGMRDELGNYTDLYYDTSAEIRDLASKYPIEDVFSLPDAAATILQDGTIALGGLTGALEDSVKAAMALDTTIPEASELLSTLRVSFDVGEESAMDFANAINYIGENSARTPKQIAQVTKSLSGVSGLAGIDAYQLSALAANITSVEPSRAATGLKDFFLALERGESATKKQQAVFNKLGLDAVEFAKDMQEDPIAAMTRFLDLFQEIEGFEKLPTLIDFSGKAGFETVSSLTANWDDFIEDYTSILNGDYIGSIDREIENQQDIVASKQQRLKNGWDEVKIAVGEGFTDEFNSVYDDILTHFDNSKDNIITIADKFAEIATQGASLEFISSALEAAEGAVTGIAWGMEKLADLNFSLPDFLGGMLPGELGNLFSRFSGMFKGVKDVSGFAANEIARGMVRNYFSDDVGGYQNRGANVIHPDMLEGVEQLKGLLDGSLQYATLLSQADVGSDATTLGVTLSDADGRVMGIHTELVNAKTAAIDLANTDFSGFFVRAEKAKSLVSGANVHVGPVNGSISGGKKQFARGGFASSASIFGERGLEAAISFDPNYRSENIGYWAEAGRLLGTLGDENPFAGNSGNVINVDVGGVRYEINPSGGNGKDIIRALEERETELADVVVAALERWSRSQYNSGESIVIRRG